MTLPDSDPAEMDKVVFFGLGEIVRDTLVWCADQGFSCAVVARPEGATAEADAGETWEQFTRRTGISLITCKTPEEIEIKVLGKRPLCFSVGAPWIFKASFLEKLGHDIYNLHGTHLPKNRGGTLFSWQILAGQRTGMCLLHQLTAGIDEGPVIAWEEFIYPGSCRKPIDFIKEYHTRNVSFLCQFIAQVVREGFTGDKLGQPPYLSSYFPRLLSLVNGWLDWSWNATELERFICAFDDPYAGARTRWRDKVVIVKDTFYQKMDGYGHPFQAGLVYRNNKKWLNVMANGGELLIGSIHDDKGENLLSRIKPGDRLYSLPQDVTDSKRRVVKTSKGLDIQPGLD